MLYIRHMIRTQVYLPKDLYYTIQLIAKREKKAKAAIIREVLEKGIEEKHKTQSLGEALLELSKIAYKGKAPKDLSTNHDKYLYEED